MAKKFAEHDGLHLTRTNQEVLAEWEKNDISIKQSTGVRGVHNLYSLKVLLQRMGILEFITF